jgi:hypothetical protein
MYTLSAESAGTTGTGYEHTGSPFTIIDPRQGDGCYPLVNTTNSSVTVHVKLLNTLDLTDSADGQIIQPGDAAVIMCPVGVRSVITVTAAHGNSPISSELVLPNSHWAIEQTAAGSLVLNMTAADITRATGAVLKDFKTTVDQWMLDIIDVPLQRSGAYASYVASDGIKWHIESQSSGPIRNGTCASIAVQRGGGRHNVYAHLVISLKKVHTRAVIRAAFKKSQDTKLVVELI